MVLGSLQGTRMLEWAGLGIAQGTAYKRPQAQARRGRLHRQYALCLPAFLTTLAPAMTFMRAYFREKPPTHTHTPPYPLIISSSLPAAASPTPRPGPSSCRGSAAASSGADPWASAGRAAWAPAGRGPPPGTSARGPWTRTAMAASSPSPGRGRTRWRWAFCGWHTREGRERTFWGGRTRARLVLGSEEVEAGDYWRVLVNRQAP